MIEILYRCGERRGRERFRDGTVRIGSAPGNDIVLDTSGVAGVHAELRYERGAWTLHAVAAVRVRGQEVRELRLPPVVQIEVGSVRLTCLQRVPGAFDAGQADAGHADAGPFDNSEQQVLSGVGVHDVARVAESVFLPARARSRAPGDVLRLLQAATDALLVEEELDAMLERLVTLVFAHLPAERAFVLLADEPPARSPDQLRVRVARAREGVSAEHIRISRSIAAAALEAQRALRIEDTAQEPSIQGAQSVAELGIRSALCAPMSREGEVHGLLYLDRATGKFTDEDLGLLAVLAGLSAAALDRARLRERAAQERRLRERLARYHAPAVVEHIVAATDDAMVAREREVSVLFADLVGFTALAESEPAEEVNARLNEVLLALTEEVFREQGTLDKFTGDGVMVFFNAPLDQPDHAARAVRTGLAMQRRVAELARDPRHTRLAMRVGIETGRAIVGDVGAHARKDYTAIGDCVNVASRLESSVATAGQVVIGPGTRAALSGTAGCDLVELAAVTLKGRARPVAACVVHALASSCEDPQ